jgi:hypothetical protein
MPGIRSYVQNHNVLVEGRPLLPYPGFDACSELIFDSLDAMDASFASEHYQTTVVADEQQMIDKSRFSLLLTERRVLEDGEPREGAVKLLSFMPLDPRAKRDELEHVLEGPYREAVAAAKPVRHEQLLTIPGAHAGRIPALCEAVDILWFGDLEAAVAFLGSAAAHQARYELAGRAFGVERVLARPVRVV